MLEIKAVKRGEKNRLCCISLLWKSFSTVGLTQMWLDKPPAGLFSLSSPNLARESTPFKSQTRRIPGIRRDAKNLPNPSKTAPPSRTALLEARQFLPALNSETTAPKVSAAAAAPKHPVLTPAPTRTGPKPQSEPWVTAGGGVGWGEPGGGIAAAARLLSHGRKKPC